MKRANLRRFTAGAIAALAIHFPATAGACTVCMGGDDRTGNAINGAIFLMLGFIGFVLASLVACGVVLNRRAKLAASLDSTPS
jgi:hypothetical protein